MAAMELLARGDTADATSAVGGKAGNLRRLLTLGANVLPGAVITSDAFWDLITAAGLVPAVEAVESKLGDEAPAGELHALRQAILEAPLAGDFLDEIRRLAAEWESSFGSRLIVRSSADVEDAAERSFAGIFESVVCEGVDDVETGIRAVWASVFTARAFAYYGIASLKHVPSMALLVQPFLEADRSGVMFTSFAGPGGSPQVLIEHVEGDCEKLVTGQVDPDRLWIHRWPEPGQVNDDGLLGSDAVGELVRMGREFEEAFGRPQDVEWLLYQGELVILQTRPITAGATADPETLEGEVLLRGVGASPGRASGPVHVVHNIEHAVELEAGSVLTTTMTNPDMVPMMQRSAAVVTDVGGMICHAAIVSRELGVPCVVGTGAATSTLSAGEEVTVDGTGGAVLAGVLAPSGSHVDRPASWPALWDHWRAATNPGAVPLLSSAGAMVAMPAGLDVVALDPSCDLSLDPVADLSSLAALDADTFGRLAQGYLERVSRLAATKEVGRVVLDTAQLDEKVSDSLAAAAADAVGVSVEPAGDAVPLGSVLATRRPAPPPEEGAGGGVFGMKPEVRMAPMPPPEVRRPMHVLVPTLAAAHADHPSGGSEQFPWLDLRPEVPITTFLKAFVTPGVEAIPYVLGFDDPPLHMQFMRCRFHFRQDTLFGFLPKLMQATWDEAFLGSMLRRCRDSYDELQRRGEALPSTADELDALGGAGARAAFLEFWRAFSEFFSLSFFIQAQGDDCVFPGLAGMAAGNAALVDVDSIDWRLPGAAELSAPVEPVLTSHYMDDLRALNRAFRSAGASDAEAALDALDREPSLRASYEGFRDRWYWMRERDLYYEPYDTERSIIDNVMKVIDGEPADYASNADAASLALAIHFDLGRSTGSSGQLLYGVKYGRALAIDRENHHIAWLRASYRLRKLLLLWEATLRESLDLRDRDVFFMQPWEILDALTGSVPEGMTERIRNRRAAYERTIQLKAGEESDLIPQPEVDYY